jgi:hypothetical protein
MGLRRSAVTVRAKDMIVVSGRLKDENGKDVGVGGEVPCSWSAKGRGRVSMDKGKGIKDKRQTGQAGKSGIR